MATAGKHNLGGGGRKKVEIKRIEKEDSRQVTFSKRRAGVFKKACELSILCGVETAIIVFSPSGKSFSFGHPSVESIGDRFLSSENNSTSPDPPQDNNVEQPTAPINADHELGDKMRDLKKEYTDILDHLEVEKKKGETLEKLRKERRSFWWESPIDELGFHELEQLSVFMEELKNNVAMRAEELLINVNATTWLSNSIGMSTHDQYPIETININPNHSGGSLGFGLYPIETNPIPNHSGGSLGFGFYPIETNPNPNHSGDGSLGSGSVFGFEGGRPN